MPAAVEIPRPTDHRRLDEAAGRLRQAARSFARLPIAEKTSLARSMLEGQVKVAERSVHASCAAKGIPLGTPAEGEEWLGGPYLNIRILQLNIESLRQIEKTGTTRIGAVDRTIDGRERVQLFPLSTLDGMLFPKITGEVHLEAGATAGERARFYKKPDHDGRVALVLGAGNQNALPSTDVISKMFNEGKVCLLKVNPVNGYVGPFIEEAFAEPIRRGFLAVVYGGGDEGAYLCKHPAVDEIHITGSDKTHDTIVWGPPGPERAERMARNRPLLDKEITGELGNVSPVLVVPGPYSKEDVAHAAENIAGHMINNASFNCNAGKILITPERWDKRDELLADMGRAFEGVPARRAYYPGAAQRYAALTEGRSGLTKVGSGEGALPWTIVPGLDPGNAADKAWTMEPFCSLISETSVGSSSDPIEYLKRAVAFTSERLWGTLSATILIHPKTAADPKAAEALERAVVELEYGAVGINIWPAALAVIGLTPWGAHPGSTLTDIQSGRGFVLNTQKLEHIEKAVVRAPFRAFPKLPYFPNHKTLHTLARRITYFEASRSLFRLPGLITAGLRA